MRSNSEPHWRDSARSARFFIWDGKTAFPMLLFVMHIRIWTLAVAVGATLFFTILNRYGYTIEVFIRMVRAALAGSRKIAISWWEES